MESNQILRLEEITKEFPGVKALDQVHLDILRGEVHALCGENGAGKSTLMKIISGAQSFTSGRMFFEGESVQFKTTREAQDSGISMIYQEFNLIPELSVAENLFIGRVPVNKYGKVNWKKLDSDAQVLLKRVGLEISTKQLISELTIGEAQMVEIAKCLSSDAKLIIMDEPTASLTDKEIEFLFQIVDNLKSQGISIIYISHRLGEVSAIADEISVLRNGKKVAHFNKEEIDMSRIVEAMLGMLIEEEFPSKSKKQRGEALLELKNLNRKGYVNNINLTVYKGEVLGITGLVGAGKTELLRLIFGADTPDGGQILIQGQEKRINSPGQAVKEGIFMIPEERRTQGILVEDSIRENITLPFLNLFSLLSFVIKKRETKHTLKIIDKIGLTPPKPEMLVKNLSGGNQQKVVIGKWFGREPLVMIFDEATIGIDVRAKQDVYQLSHDLGQNAGVIYASSDIDEILGVSDRVLVMRDGEIVAEMSGENATRHEVLEYATGAHAAQGNDHVRQPDSTTIS